MMTFEEFELEYIPGHHRIKVDGEYVTACYLENYKRIPKMGFCKRCKKELGSIEIGCMCFDCRELKWDR